MPAPFRRASVPSSDRPIDNPKFGESTCAARRLFSWHVERSSSVLHRRPRNDHRAIRISKAFGVWTPRSSRSTTLSSPRCSSASRNAETPSISSPMSPTLAARRSRCAHGTCRQHLWLLPHQWIRASPTARSIGEETRCSCAEPSTVPIARWRSRNDGRSTGADRPFPGISVFGTAHG